MSKKFIIETIGRETCYSLPGHCGEINGVQYADRLYDMGFALFEAPITRAWLRVYALDSPPQTPDEAEVLLKRAYTRVSYRPVWLRLGNELYIYPPVLNDGDYLIVTIEPSDETAK